MRVLLDECVSEGLRIYLAGHDCQTARYAGFAGLENGELLAAAENSKFEVVLTGRGVTGWPAKAKIRRKIVFAFCSPWW
jgi:hypothetical protein